MTECFVCLINLHCVLIRIAQKISVSIFLSHVLTYQKERTFTSGGIQNRATENRRLEMIVKSLQITGHYISRKAGDDWEICLP